MGVAHRKVDIWEMAAMKLAQLKFIVN